MKMNNAATSSWIADSCVHFIVQSLSMLSCHYNAVQQLINTTAQTDYYSTLYTLLLAHIMAGHGQVIAPCSEPVRLCRSPGWAEDPLPPAEEAAERVEAAESLEAQEKLDSFVSLLFELGCLTGAAACCSSASSSCNKAAMPILHWISALGLLLPRVLIRVVDRGMPSVRVEDDQNVPDSGVGDVSTHALEVAKYTCQGACSRLSMDSLEERSLQNCVLRALPLGEGDARRDVCSQDGCTVHVQNATVNLLQGWKLGGCTVCTPAVDGRQPFAPHLQRFQLHRSAPAPLPVQASTPQPGPLSAAPAVGALLRFVKGCC